MISITTPLQKEEISKLKAGDQILLSGTIYTGRDAAHKRLCELIKKGEQLPFPVKDNLLYYVGPTPAKPGEVIGSAGPTTSYRMDTYTVPLLKLGLAGTIGKGYRSEEVKEGMKQYGCIYLGAVGGAGALLSKCIISSEIIAYEDLGAEAIRKLEVKNLPLVVIVDEKGEDLYKIGPKQYLDS